MAHGHEKLGRDGLTDKQLRFIDEYMIDFNATQAYIRAGYSPNAANVNSVRIMNNPLVQEEIKNRQAQLSNRMKKTKEDIIANLEEVVDQFLLDGRLTPNALKAIELLSKLNGWNEVEKQEILHKGLVVNYIKPDGDNIQSK